MKMEFKKCNFILTLIVLNAWAVSPRASPDQDEHVEKEQEPEEIQLHVITKREAVNDIQQDYPHVNGRTFRASDPLDPNGPGTDDNTEPQALFQGFETEGEVFQPQLDDGNSEEAERRAESDVGQHTGNNEGNNDNSTGSEYSAQYPYAETTDRNQYQSSVSRTGTGSNGYQTNDGVQQSVTTRRVVLAGRGSDTSENGHHRTHTSGEYTEYQPSQTSRSGYTTQTDGSSRSRQYESRYSGTSRQVSNERRVYTGSELNSQNSGYNSGTSGTSNYQGYRTETRRPAYNGPRYRDSNGHYVDAQGRHLDSTGRYYDVSGRYTDATMTRTQTYRNIGSGSSGGSETSSGTNYYPGTNSGYYDSNGRYVSGTRGTSSTSGTSGRSGGYYDSYGRYVQGSTQQGSSYNRNQGGRTNVDTSRSRPVDSYGGTQFYSGGSSYRTTYDPIASQISSDPNCPVTNTRVTINGLTCNNAVAQLGPYVCYNYERVSTECCERCLQVKRSEYAGCEYGDRSHQCEDINPYDCYNEQNRRVCCARCRQFREQRSTTSSAGCEYGDMTPRCSTMLQRPHLCYLPENQRICCESCPRLANRQEPDCQWGNQSPDLCRPFSAEGRLQLNCYLHQVQEICCSTCRSLRDRMRDNIPGCEYGDSPVLFYSGREVLDCPGYISRYGLDNCNDPEISRKCCYTCYRYRRARG